MPDIWFPNLGIKIAHLSKSAFSIFGLEIAWYGIIIAIGVIAGYLVAAGIARRTKQNPEMYLDFLIFALIFAIIGARLYYVIFSWDQYKDNLLQIFNLRNGGLAIFGGVIGAVATAVVFCKKSPVYHPQMSYKPGQKNHHELLGVLRETGFSDDAHAGSASELQLRPAAPLEEQLQRASR